MRTLDSRNWWRYRFWLGVIALFILGWIWPIAVAPFLALLVVDRWVSLERPLAREGVELADLWGPASVFLTFLIIWVYFQLLTRGSADFFQPDALGAAYGSLGDAFLSGGSALSPEAIRWEAMRIDGRAYMYFGPWPALLRMPLNLGLEGYWGLWSRLSAFVAASVALGSFIRLARRALNENQSFQADNARLIFLSSILAFGLGTPLLFLTISASIYHESILWGLAASTFALDAAWRILVKEEASLWLLVQLSLAAAVALLSRVTFGAPILGVLALCAVNVWGRRRLRPDLDRSRRTMLAIFLSLLPALAAILFQAFYNVDRFGSPLVFARLDLLEYMVANRESWASFEIWGSLNVRRIPIAVFNYFGFQPQFLSETFPWVQAIRAWHPDQNLYPQMFDSLVVSLLLASPCFVFGTVVGFFWLFASSGQWFLKICALGLLTECFLVFSYFIMEQRYAADFLPFMILGYALFLRGPGKPRTSFLSQNALANILLVLALISAANTMMTSVSVIPRHGVAQPPAYRNEWTIRFENINRALGLQVEADSANSEQ